MTPFWPSFLIVDILSRLNGSNCTTRALELLRLIKYFFKSSVNIKIHINNTYYLILNFEVISVLIINDIIM